MKTEAELLSLLGDIPANRDHLPELAAQVGTRSGIVPFAGAGLSVPFQFPAWGDFLCELAAEAGTLERTRDQLDSGCYEEAASELSNALEPRRFNDLLAKAFGDHVLAGRQITGAVRQLTAFPPGPVVTTNFDRVLETAFAQASRPLTPYTIREADRGPEALQQNKPFLLKLHGDWDRPEARVLTLGEYEAAYGTLDAKAIHAELPLPLLLSQILLDRCCLFLGCSLKQDRTVQILRAIARRNQRLVHYAVIERPAADGEFRRRAAELSAQNIRPVWFPTGRFDCIEPLLEYLSAKALEGLRSLVRSLSPPAPAAGRETPNNIPSLNNRTIGRDVEIGQVSSLLRLARVLTVTGAGGCGKSRLAIEASAAVKEDYPDGVWFVALAALGKADKEGVLAPRVGRIIGAPEAAGRPPHESLAEHIGEKRMLLVLDNCEHLTNSCRGLISYLLPACPNLTFLATTRRPLDRRTHAGSRLPQERLYPLAPLEKPDEEEQSLEVIARIESVMLFVERTRERTPDWRLTPPHAKAVSELCRALDGIPLAIEVAAARFSVKSLEDMTADCRSLLAAIGNIRRGDLLRWKTLTTALKWSYGLLTHRQQAFMRAMSVFDGGWNEQSAASVYSLSVPDRTSVLDHLEELISNSLVVSSESNGARRFRFLEPVRQMAEAQLRVEERKTFERAHATYFLELAEQASPKLLEANQAQWLDRLQADVDNFRATFRWCVRNAEAECGLRLVAAIWRFAEIRGYLTEGRARAREVLALPAAEQHPALLAKALSGAGMLAYRQADFQEAGAMFERCLAIETAFGNEAGRANALNDLGNLANMEGRFTLASRRYAECMEIEQRRGNARAVAVAKFNMGMVAAGIGDYTDAERLMTESVQEFRAGGNERESAFPLNGLAQVAVATGRTGLAQDYAQASYDIRYKLGDTKGKADALRTLGWAALESQDSTAASAKLCESISLARGVGDRRGVAETLELFGILFARQGRGVRSVEALGAAEQIRHGFNYALPPIRAQRRDAALAEGLRTLGELEYERAWKRGFASSLGDAVDRAMKPEAAGAAG